MTKRIDFAAKDGAHLGGQLAEPSGSGKVGAVVVVQEWHGVNDYVRSLADRFAAAGFLAMAIDIYHGRVAKNDQEAGAMMGALDKPKAVKEIGDAVAYLAAHERSNGKVAVTGFCLGGALTLAAAASLPGIAAAVPFYGLPGDLDWTKVTAPILAHFAKVDDWATVAGAEKIKAAIEKAGKATMELHAYDAGHAFMRDTDPRKHEPQSAKLAWERTIAFLRGHLA